MAYVFDEDGDFEQERCNLAGVDLEAVIDERDIELLRNAIDRHLIATESPRAQWILEHWADTLPQFIKIFPHEYKRVLGVPRH